MACPKKLLEISSTLRKAQSANGKMNVHCRIHNSSGPLPAFFDVSLDYLLGLSNDPKAISQSYAMAALLDASADVQRSPASDDDLKFALFGSSKDITDAQFEEVKRFAQFIKERGNR